MQAQTDRTALAREEPREGPLKLNSSRLQPQGRAGEEALRSVRKYASTADEAFEDVAAASLSRLGRVG
jgi:hypothetical protein